MGLDRRLKEVYEWLTLISRQWTPTVMAAVILLAIIFSLLMLIVDLVYAFIDPRIKAKYAKS